MCIYCGSARPLLGNPGRRDFLKASVAVGAAAASGFMAVSAANAQEMPSGSGDEGRRILIRGGHVLSMDPDVGDFEQADVLISGRTIEEIGPDIDATDAEIIEAEGMIVMPGFVDTHLHQFETGLRSSLADGILINDGRPENEVNYYEYILQKFSMVYRPQDVYINELFGSIAQLDTGVTTVMDVSQIHHSPEHSDAAIEALRDAGRRSVFGYFEGWGDDARYPEDASRIRDEHFASNDQLLTMVMGGEIYLPGYERAWEIGRELDLTIAAHIVGTFGMQPGFDALAEAGMFGDDNIFIHMTGMSDMAWQAAADAGAHVSLAVPIEMQMRHGMPPIQRALDLGMQPSLSSDVECTMTADPFTQMRSCMTLQRAFINQRALEGEEDPHGTAPLSANWKRAATICSRRPATGPVPHRPSGARLPWSPLRLRIGFRGGLARRGGQPLASCSARRAASVSSTASRIVRPGMSISTMSPSRTRRSCRPRPLRARHGRSTGPTCRRRSARR
jgi:5-methylthioadenosine/S-adenosylhomocysteine deaminase